MAILASGPSLDQILLKHPEQSYSARPFGSWSCPGASRRLVVPNYFQTLDNAIHRLPPDARLAPPSAMIARANATTAKPAPSVKRSAMIPMTGGPNKKPQYPAVDTAAIASSGKAPGILPAVLNRIGTAFASPRPAAAKPMSAAIGLASQSPAASVRAAIPDPAARTPGPLQRRTIRSPRKRPAAMASENAAKPSAAKLASAAKSSRR